jgi:hypothetical protein
MMAREGVVLELRVHGVAGTPPQDMLGVDASDVVQVAGDQRTGFYRCADGVNPYGPARPDNVAVEAYSWGGLTSGVTGFLDRGRRVLWLTLLPFALANLAYWTRPGISKASKWGAIWMRVAGLLLTLLLVSAMFTIGVDLVAWQCFRGGSKVCQSVPAVFDFLARPPWDSPTRRLLVGSMLPFTVLMLLWFLSLQSLHRYEAVAANSLGAARAATPAVGAVLQRRDMWFGRDRTKLLRRLHVNAGTLYVVLLATAPMLSYHHAPTTALAIVAGLLLVHVLFLTAVTYTDGVEFSSTAPGQIVSRILRWTPPLVVAAYVIILYFFPPPDVEQSSLITGHNLGMEFPLFALVLLVTGFLLASVSPWLAVAGIAWIVGVAWYVFAADPSDFDRAWAVGVAAFAALMASVWALRRRTADGRTRPYAWRGAGPAMVLGAAVWVAALFTTSTVVWMADFLNGGQQSAADLLAEFNSDESPGYLAQQIQQTPAMTFFASGSPTLSGVLLQREGAEFTVAAGTVTADQITVGRGVFDGDLRSGPDNAPLQSLTGVEVSSGRVKTTGILTLVEACVVNKADPPQRQTCTGDGWGTYVANGTLGEHASTFTLPIDGNVSVNSREALQEHLVVPLPLIYFAGILPFWLFGVLLVVIACLVKYRNRKIADAVDHFITKDFASLDPPLPGHLRERSRKARTNAGLTHRAERLLGLVAAVTSAAALLVLLGSATVAPPWDEDVWRWVSNGQEQPLVRSVVNGGLFIALGVSLLLLATAAKLRDSDSLRRSVGILWDLTTFWPRVAHPLGPPCYAERVVPEVIDRVNWARSRGARVILSAHSQGSTIAVAALSQMIVSMPGLDEIRLVTYGSQIRTWYGRIFPGVFGAAEIGYEPLTDPIRFEDPAPDMARAEAEALHPASGSLAARLKVGNHDSRWINLFRRTDPIGFRVFSDFDHRRADRQVSEFSPGNYPADPDPMLQLHSRYQFSRTYEQVVAQWYVHHSGPAPDAEELLRPTPLVK